MTIEELDEAASQGELPNADRIPFIRRTNPYTSVTVTTFDSPRYRSIPREDVVQMVVVQPRSEHSPLMLGVEWYDKDVLKKLKVKRSELL